MMAYYTYTIWSDSITFYHPIRSVKKNQNGAVPFLYNYHLSYLTREHCRRYKGPALYESGESGCDYSAGER